MGDILLSRGKTLPDSGFKNDLHELIDLTTATISNIVNEDISATAAIAGTKISPNFGSQNISTTGNLACAVATITGNANIGGALALTGAMSGGGFDIEWAQKTSAQSVSTLADLTSTTISYTAPKTGKILVIANVSADVPDPGVGTITVYIDKDASQVGNEAYGSSDSNSVSMSLVCLYSESVTKDDTATFKIRASASGATNVRKADLVILTV